MKSSIGDHSTVGPDAANPPWVTGIMKTHTEADRSHTSQNVSAGEKVLHFNHYFRLYNE